MKWLEWVRIDNVINGLCVIIFLNVLKICDVEISKLSPTISLIFFWFTFKTTTTLTLAGLAHNFKNSIN